MMEWRNYIVSNEAVLLGKPAIKGTRLSVEFLLGLFAQGWTEEQVLANYPRLKKEDLQALFLYLQECIKDGLMFSSKDFSTV